MAPWRGTLVKAINGRAVRIKSRKSSSPSTAALFALPFHGDHAVESLKAITKIFAQRSGLRVRSRGKEYVSRGVPASSQN
jgi:hypothetical protein